MKTKQILFSISLIFLGFAAGRASGQFRLDLVDGFSIKKDHLSRPQGGPEERFAKLGVDKERLKKIREIENESKEKHQRLFYQLEEKRQSFESLSTNTKDWEAIEEAFDQFLAMRNKIEKERFVTMTKVHHILSLDEIKKLREMGPPPGENGPPPRHGRGEGHRPPPPPHHP